MTGDIKNYVSKKYISFHTPAHKGRNKYINDILRAEYDLTELKETDNLFCENGCIKEMEEELNKKFNGKGFIPLVNGATSGVMAAVNLFKEGDKILIDRNCHISVINALILSGATPVFIETELNSFNIPCPTSLGYIKKIYEENKDAKALFITSINYYGMKADLRAISSFCKEKGLISIADEAHGTHYYYLNEETGTKAGFDVCILSFHKNLPSLTQTGGIIVNNPELSEKIKNNLRMFTSTSPSYLFMLSVDNMNRFMCDEGALRLEKTIEYCLKVKESLLKSNIKILNDNDPTKFVINCKDASKRAEDIKRKYGIVCEMCDECNITYIISLHNYKKEIGLLKKAILEFLKEENDIKETFILPKSVMTPKEASLLNSEEIEINKAKGRISGEYIINFPPSVPIIIPGEIIDENVIKRIKDKRKIKCVRK